ncbi:tetratricopeptide repeat protein [Corynebacterium crudilactis]|uniref:Co-chaperone YbbN n=1 Tax=Corynebacterium crudilactis TaxID=1652495 RepID=A0A172QSU6_9CORY|nr:tetratricopeptide repeat protein [Corynebacterium crudilactis]ANE03787.1 co-chaperone YbbN [Corynebacterium crudilactis]
MTTPNRFVSGAIDLGEVKARADARQKAHEQGPASQGIATSIEVTMETLENEVLRRSTQVPVIVLVGTPRSPDSEQLKSDLSALAAQSELKFIFAYVNADTDADVAQVFGVQGLPSVIAVAAGRPLADFQGGQPAEALKQWTDQVIQAISGQLEGLPAQPSGKDADEEVEVEDPRFDAATDALNRGAFDEAIAVYDAILAEEPGHADAKQARDTAKLLARLSEVDSAVDVIVTADADPQSVDKAFAAADAAVVAGNPEAAFDRLVALLMISAGAQKDQVKERLLELFGMFEAADPRVLQARGKMASALF